MNDAREEVIFYNPPGTSHAQKNSAGYPPEENINLGLFIRGKPLAGYPCCTDFLVPGMKGFEEMRALIQLAGTPKQDYFSLYITWGELRSVLETAGVDVSQLVTR